jgi:RNA polymerase sigma factor (sigma-70 family)
VKAIPGTLREGGAPFSTTHWSVIAACTLDNGSADTALAQLCHDYWPPLYSFVRRRGYSSTDAQDLVQGFFAHLLESKAYTKTDQTRGKFRSFLLASLKHYMADVWDRERALKRGGNCSFVLLEEEIQAVESASANGPTVLPLDEEQQYEQRWAASLVAHALERVRREFDNVSKEHLFDGLKPFLSGGVGLPGHEEVAARLAMPVETLRSHLSRLRTRYRAFLREEVARTVGPADDVDEELRYLRSVLIAAL